MSKKENTGGKKDTPKADNTNTNENKTETANENVQDNKSETENVEQVKTEKTETQDEVKNAVKPEPPVGANSTAKGDITDNKDNITLIEPEKTKAEILAKDGGENILAQEHLDNNNDKDIIKDNDNLDSDDDDLENIDSHLYPEDNNAMDPERDGKTSIAPPTVRVGPDYTGLDTSNLARYYHKPKSLDAGVVIQRINDPDGKGRLFKVGPNPKDKVELSAYETLDEVQAKNYREKGIIF